MFTIVFTISYQIMNIIVMKTSTKHQEKVKFIPNIRKNPLLSKKVKLIGRLKNLYYVKIRDNFFLTKIGVRYRLRF